MIEKMWEILTTLTEESQQAALLKCAELGLDTNRGFVSLDESFINLNEIRTTLIDAIEKKKLIQLPITVQKLLIANLEAISRYQVGLITGTDEVVNLANSIEQLNTAIWQYGLHNLSDEVLGYQTKLNQLKNLELEAKDLKRTLDAGIKSKVALEALLGDITVQGEEAKKVAIAATTASNSANDELGKILDAGQKAAALLTVIQQNEISATQQLAIANASVAGIAAHEQKITEFFGRINEYRTAIDTVEDEAKKSVKTNKEETNTLVSKLVALEGQIKEQLQKATGVSLFHSFGTRQEALSKSKKMWLWIIAGLVVASIVLTIYVLKTTTDMNIEFFLKLSMSLPLIFAFAFCSVQYSRERKLEEEYAFKSNISISLVPYQELVEKLVTNNQPGEREKYTAFIIDSITKVFTSPTEKIFHPEDKQKTSSDSIKQVTSLVETIGKALNH